MKADKYYGSAVASYDADRCHSLRWAREQLAVDEFVTSGPVLDVPIGTGRYCGIYRDKGLSVTGIDVSADMIAQAKRNYPWLDARHGSVFALPFHDGAFETAVCTRLLDWLTPQQMFKAVGELRRVARTIVVTIRHGEEGQRVNYTHDLGAFYGEIHGLFIEARRTTEITRDGHEEIFKLRPPSFADVIEQFRYHGHTPAYELQRLANEWVGRLWDAPVIVDEDSVDVSAEYWTREQIALAVASSAQWDHLTEPPGRYMTDEPPRYPGGPITVLVHQGQVAILDGRRRANQHCKTDGFYPVLALRRRAPSS